MIRSPLSWLDRRIDARIAARAGFVAEGQRSDIVRGSSKQIRDATQAILEEGRRTSLDRGDV